MAKKKKAKHKKKVYRRQAARPAAVAGAVSVASSNDAPEPLAPAAPTPVQAPVTVVAMPQGIQAARWSYMGSDVRRIGVLATSCVVVELALWYLFTYTGLGSAAYGLIK